MSLSRGAGALLLLFICFASARSPEGHSQVSLAIQTLLDHRKYEEAERAVRIELDRSPDWDVGHLLLGQIYNLTGRYEQAERSAQEAVRLRESLDGFMLLAVATMHLRKLNESIGWLDKAANLQSDFPDIYKVLGLDYALGGNLLESEKAFRRALEMDPLNWEFHYLHGRTLYELRLFQESDKSLQQAVRLNPQSTKAWTALGQTQESLYDPVAAETSYRKGVEVCQSQTHECAWPLMQLGFLASRQKGPKDAEELFRKSIAARPDWAKPHFYLGKTLATLGDFNGALAEMEKALRLDESKSEYHYQIAQVYRRLDDVQKAERHMERYQALTDTESKEQAAAEITFP